MQICEKCGAYYKPTAQAPDCPECAAAARKTSAPAATQPVAQRAKPAAPAATAAKTAAPSESSRTRATEQPARRAVAAAPKPAAKPAARAPAPVHEPTPVRHHAPADAGGLDKATKIGMIAAGALAAVVAIVLLIVKSKHDDDRRAADALAREVSDLYAKMQALDINDEAGASQIIQLAKEKESTWKPHSLAPQISSLSVRASQSLIANKEKHDMLESFESLEKQIKGSETQPVEKIKNIRRGLEELQARVELGGPQLVERYNAARATADKTFATRLVDEAKTLAEGDSGSARLALQRYQTAEDELKKMLDAAFHAKNAEGRAFYEPLYRQAIESSDHLTASVFTADAIEKLPWTDCLSGTKVTEWSGSSTKGFSHRIEKGAFQLVGPDPGAKDIAIIAIGDIEQWRSYVLDIEFMIESGGLDLCFRLGKTPSQNTTYFTLQTAGEKKNIDAGKTYKAKASLIGSQFIFRFSDDTPGLSGSFTDQLDWTKSRKGAIGILIPPGARAKFTRFKVQDLH